MFFQGGTIDVSSVYVGWMVLKTLLVFMLRNHMSTETFESIDIFFMSSTINDI